MGDDADDYGGQISASNAGQRKLDIDKYLVKGTQPVVRQHLPYGNSS